jgi:hypothetical protein
MNMKDHILAALREEFDQWEKLLTSLNAEQIAAPRTLSDWTVKDVIAHVMAWQQRTIARVEAALLDREPAFPAWQPGLDPEIDGNTDQVNAWIYEHYREQPWAVIHKNWKAGYQGLLESAQAISERDLLDTSRYAWLEGYSIALILLATYDHHQEHYEKLQAWLQG